MTDKNTTTVLVQNGSSILRLIRSADGSRYTFSMAGGRVVATPNEFRAAIAHMLIMAETDGILHTVSGDTEELT